MKICMVSFSRYYDSRPFRFASALKRRGHEVHMICEAVENHMEPDVIQGINTHPIHVRRADNPNPLTYLWNYIHFFTLATFRCAKLYRKHRFDIMHFHNVPDFGVFSTIVPKLSGAKVIHDIHDVVPEFFMRKFCVSEDHLSIRVLKWIEKMACHFADHTLTVTDIWRDRLINRSVKPEKCSVVLNVPDPNVFHKIEDNGESREHAFLISYHGNIKEPSGIDVLIKAMKKVTDHVPDVSLQITGSGEGADKDRIVALAEDIGVQGNIIYRKPVPYHDIPLFMNHVDLGIDPKRGGVYAGETLSVKAMEYLSMGIPLVVAKTVAAQAYFDESMVSFFNPDDDESLADQILKLHASKEMRDTMVKNAEKFIEKYSWNRYEDVYFDLIEKKLNRNSRGD